MGATTEATPTPMPPTNRKIWNSVRCVTKALPSAPTFVAAFAGTTTAVGLAWGLPGIPPMPRARGGLAKWR